MSRLNSTEQKSALADALYLSAIGKAGIPALNSTSKLQPLCERWAVMVASPRLRPLGQLMLYRRVSFWKGKPVGPSAAGSSGATRTAIRIRRRIKVIASVHFIGELWSGKRPRLGRAAAVRLRGKPPGFSAPSFAN